MLIMPGPTPAKFRLPDKFKIAGVISDFPPAINGVVTLDANTGYMIAGTIDFAGARLIAPAGCALFGISFEMATGDYIELFVSASQNDKSILVSDMNLLIKRLTD